MMILPIPIGVEENLRKLPWATIVLIAINVLSLVCTSFYDAGTLLEQEQKIERLAGWEFEKTGQAQPSFEALRKEYPTALALLCREDVWGGAIDDEATRRKLQGYLTDYRAASRDHPYHRFGFIPTDITPLRLVLHMFIHGGILHLFFNMLFLWIVGCVLESTWGRPVFLLVYFLSGIAAAMGHAAWQPQSVEPAVGASGAVAGLMGAFAVQHARTPIKIALIYALGLIPRVRFVAVPAYVFLCLWFLEQLFWALLTVDMNLGIAFWAHIGGFVFGAMAGGLVRLMLAKTENT